MKHEKCMRPAKVAIIGAGCVGATAAYAMMLEGDVSEIALIDIRKEKVEGEMLDLQHGMQFTRSASIVAGDSFELVHGAQVIVIAAGLAQKPGEKRTDVLEKNAKIFSEIIPKIVQHNKEAILLVVTNPLDVLTYITYKLSGLSSCQVFGTGTVLDSSRLRFLLGQHLNISPKDITAYILGEHGPTEFAWWSSANVGGVGLDQFASLDTQLKDTMLEQVRSAAYEVINKKGATFYAIALVISRIARAVIQDQSRALTVSCILQDYQGYSDVAVSIPTIIRRNGVCSRMPLVLDNAERTLFAQTIEKVQADIEVAKRMLG